MGELTFWFRDRLLSQTVHFRTSRPSTLDWTEKTLTIFFSEMIADVDLNGNGKVEFEEFLIMMNSKTKRLDSDNGIDIAFQIFDSNKDGLISADELK